MEMNIYAVLDRKMREFGQVVAIRNDFAAMRAISDTLSEEGTIWSKHPEDFDLYCLGSMDPQNGMLVPETPRLVSTFLDLDGRKKDA